MRLVSRDVRKPLREEMLRGARRVLQEIRLQRFILGWKCA
jgi:hypothetical protein